MLDQLPDKLLIVDDEPEIGRTLKQFLDDEGYTSLFVSSGSAALDILENDNSYTIALLDIKMPGIDGVTVLKRLKERGSEVAVIMMSGHGSEDLAVACMKDGAEDYISKPFSFEDLLQRIDRTITHRWERIEKKRLEQEKEDFILMLSHDMKNPLTAAIGSIDIISEGCLGTINAEQKEYLHSAIDSCNEVVTMIDNLLDIRKFEAGKLQIKIKPCNPQELISKIVSRYARQTILDGIELTADIDVGSSETAIDESSLSRVLGNLLGNAIKFTPEGGRIIVSCRSVTGSSAQELRTPSYVSTPPDFFENRCFIRLSVRDTGNGIASDELDRIFDRFTQFARKTENKRVGAGLGLTYCKLAIENFQGIIWAESEPEQWSEFIILLPCCSCSGN